MSADRWRSPDASSGLPDAADVVSACPGGAEVAVRVVPRAGASKLAGVRNGALVIRLAAAPVDGAANDALVSLLATALQVAPRNIAITAGHRSRNKRLSVHGADPAILREKLSALIRDE